MTSHRIWTLCIAVACCLTLFAGVAECKTVFVSQSTGSDNNDGLSWSTAKASVGQGLEAAVAGDEVWVAKGVYLERITISRSIGLYGGFAGNETDREQRDRKTNPTILDGRKAWRVVTLNAAGAVLDGFVVRNGRGQGGGVWAGASTTVSNNLITGNSAQSNAGGVWCSAARVLNNVIRGNVAMTNGGGIACSSQSQVRAEVSGNIISDNYSSIDAVATCSGNVCFTNNTVVNNHGSGVSCGASASTVVANNIVAFNSAGVSASSALPVLRNNCVYNPDGDNYTGIAPGAGDISADPKMAGYCGASFHIQPNSPCRDAGWNDALALPVFDIDGQARVQPAGGSVDIGADESDGTQWSADPVVVRVSPNGDDLNDGSSWALAKKSVQTAADAVADMGGEVWVAAGTYHERIAVPPGAYLYGGFAGNEDTRDARDWRTNATIIDGDSLGSVVSTPYGGYGRSAIDGFIIQHGKSEAGGGICCTYAAPYIANNTIADNTAEPWGGGIYCQNASPVVAHNTIVRNIATDGTGIYSAGNSAPQIINNAVASNHSPSAGGYAVCLDGRYQLLINNTIIGHNGGGIYFKSDSQAVVENNIIAFNLGGMNYYYKPAVVRNNCLFNQYSQEYVGQSMIIFSQPGDVMADPKIAGWQFGNFHLQPDSPCRNAGANDAPGLPSVDIDGQPRIQPAGGRVDMGVDESDGTSWTVNAAIVRVSPDGDDANDGSSWALAKKSIQGGIDAAMACNGEVWVKTGTYKERIKPNATSSLPYGMQSAAYLYGGFAGTETTRDTRDWKANPTIIDGEHQGSVITTINNGNVLGAVDGFTITNGYAEKGGGIWCGSRSEIANNTITGNQATGIGGGIYLSEPRYWYSTVPILNNKISGNSASNGGGIASSGQAFRLIGNIIANNSGAPGAGLYISTQYGNSSPSSICNNSFVSNYGAGISLVGSYSSTPAPLVAVTNNAILNNYTYGIQISGSCAMPISNNIIAYNGTGIYAPYASRDSLTLRNNCYYNVSGMDFYPMFPGLGDIQVDPKLAGGWWTGGYPVHIQPDSPCRDAGWNGAPDVPGLDADGQPRIQPMGGTIDIGADESDGTEWTWGKNPATIRVSTSGDDANDGSTWTLAKRTVQAGIDAAAPSGGNVWVAAGTYQERIALKHRVHIYGGFAGTENALSERPAFPRPSPDPAETILDGQKLGSVVRIIRLWDDCGVDGFTITNGFGSPYDNFNNDFFGNQSGLPSGGGILCDFSSPIIAHNTIKGNWAAYGGGVYLSNSNAQVIDNLITGNDAPYSAGFGGGLYACVGSPVIKGNTISNNTAHCSGGMNLWRCDKAVVDSNRITGNTTIVNGGGLTCVISNATITRNIVANNGAANLGGGMDLGLGGTMTVTDNVVLNNKAPHGAGVWMDGWYLFHPYLTQFGLLTVNLVNNTIAGCDGVGIECIHDTKGFIANNIVAFNTAGISNYSTAITIRNNDIYTPGQTMKLPDNISVNPHFTGLPSGNIHLAASSACINAGWNDAPGLPVVDFDSQKRIYGGAVDIGADEWSPGPRVQTGLQSD